MSGQSKFFEAFKKQQRSPRYKVNKRKNSREFYFALFSDDVGVYVKSVNKNLKDKRVNSDNYSGCLKDVIDLYNLKKTSTKLIVDWNNPYGHIYLDRHPDLMEALTTVDNLVDNRGKTIYCGSRTYPFTLNIRKINSVLECQVNLCENIVDRVINENYSLVGNRILSTLPLGPGYRSLIELNTNIVPEELGRYLSIVFSNFKNIELCFKGYKVVTKGECELIPSIIIDSVDGSGFMLVKTSFSYKSFISPEFYLNYKPSKLAIVNRESLDIELFDLTLPDEDVLDRLIRLLYLLDDKYELRDSFNIEEDGVLLNPALANLIFNSELKSIVNNFSIYGDKVLNKHKIKKSSANVELVFTSAIDYLQGSAILNVSGEKLPLFDAISEFDSNGYVSLTDGTRGVINKKYIEKIKRVIREGKDGIEVSFFDLPYIERELEAKYSGSSFIERVEMYKRSNEILDEISIDISALNGELREYQSLGVKWMLNLHRVGVSGCLSDDMGLGKTVQTITLLLNVFKESTLPTLIVMPKSLIFNWIKEFEKFAPEIDIYAYYGNKRDRELIKSHRVILTTYHTLRNDIEIFREKEFFYAILDEIQSIKNHTSQISKAAYLVNSRYRLGISGTPIENSLGDLYSISRFLNPTLFGSFKSFKDRWSGPMASEDSEIVTNILKNKIKPLFLRRIKEDVLKELPPKTEQVLYIEMNDKQAGYYERVRKDYHDKIRLKIRDEGIDRSQLTILKAFMELRQIATIPEYKSNGLLTSPKKEVMLEQLYETIEGGHKVLIFSNFLSAIKGLSESLTEDEVGHRVITGATNKREKAVEEFMDDPNIKVMIMTLKTGGVGLNLTAASYVYIMDPWWNLASENQAIDRTHRIGQENSVFCYRYITRGTIEEKILQLQDKKRELFNNLFSTTGSLETGFTKEDIDYLLG